MLARYDTLLKANSDRPEGPDSPPLINLRDLFVAVQSELTEWGIFWTSEIKAMNPDGYVLQLILNQEHGKLQVRRRVSIPFSSLIYRALTATLSFLQIAHHWLYQAFRFPNLPWINLAKEWESERRAALASCLGSSIKILKVG